MLHLLCTLVRLATTSVAGGATLSYNQLAGADAASARFHVRCRSAAPLSSRPLGGVQARTGDAMEDLSFSTLSSQRLTVRRFRADDAEPFAAYRSDPAVARYQGWEAPYSLEI